MVCLSDIVYWAQLALAALIGAAIAYTFVVWRFYWR